MKQGLLENYPPCCSLKNHAEKLELVSGSVCRMIGKQNGLFFTVDFDVICEVFAVLLFNVENVRVYFRKRLQSVVGDECQASYDSNANAILTYFSPRVCYMPLKMALI